MQPAELASFVPTWLTQGLDPRVPARSSLALPGALLFADVSGFTALAHALGVRHGVAGAEALSAALGGFLNPLLAEVRLAGGEVASIAGDGLLAFFPAPDGDLGEAVLAASTAALAMNRRIAAVPSTEGVSVGLHAGIAAGDVRALAVGGHRDRWLGVVLGEPVSQLREIFPGSARGETVLSRGAVEALGDRAIVRPLDARRSLLVDVRRAPRALARPSGARPAADLERWLPDAIRARAGMPLGAWLADLRTLSLVFVSLPDADAEDAVSISAAVRAVQAELEAHHGTLHQVATDEKGLSITCAFGLAGGERPPASACRCALAVASRLAELGVRAGAGVATGRMFVGSVGDAARRELALVGPAMIQAARMAQLARGVLADDASAAASRDEIDLAAGPELPARGGAPAIPTFRITGARRRALGRSREPLVGREDAVAAIESALAGRRSGAEPIVVLEGPAGIGKSRLVGWLLDRAREEGLPAIEALCDLVSSAQPYHAWRGALERRLEIAESAGTAARARAADRAVAERPGARGLAPLLGPALGVAIADTERTSGLAAQARADATAELIASLLASPGSVIVVDDAQWMDGASAAVLRALREAAAPALVLASMRPPSELPPELALLRSDPAARRIELAPLAEAEVERLAAARLGVERVPAALARWLSERAGGNPFFVREVAASLLAGGVVEIRAGRLDREPTSAELDRTAPPASVEAVVTRRIDALAAAAQLALKAASVLGMRVDARALGALHPLGAQAAEDGLAALDAAGLCTRLDGETWEIGHRIVMEVAYGLLSSDLRGGLHRQAARWLEDAPKVEAAQLAWHWERAGEPERARRWLETAWSDADRAGALSEAHAIARRAIALDASAPSAGHHARLERARWHRRMADASANLSMYSRAIEEARLALAELGRALPTDGGAWTRKLASAGASQLAHSLLPRRLWAPRRGDADVETDAEAALALSRAAEGYYFVAGDQRVALACFVESANAAERAGVVGRVPSAYGVIGVALTAMGVPRVGRSYLDAGLAEARAIGDGRDEATALFHLASSEAMLGRWDAASAIYERCAERCVGSGSRFLLVFVRTAQSLNAILTGEHRRAEALAEELLALAAQVRQERGEAMGLAVRARVALGRGEIARAIELARRGRDLLRAREDLAWATAAGWLGRALLAAGEREQALAEARAILAALADARPADYRRLEGYAAPAQILIASGADRGEIAAALALLDRFARAHRVGRARHHLLAGLALRASDRAGASAAMRAAADEAARAGLGLDLARAQLALEELGGDRAAGDRARRWLASEEITHPDA